MYTFIWKIMESLSMQNIRFLVPYSSQNQNHAKLYRIKNHLKLKAFMRLNHAHR